MKYSWLIGVLLLLIAAPQVSAQEQAPGEAAPPESPAAELDAPEVPAAPARTPGVQPSAVELIDVPSDDGTAIGVLWHWDGEPGPNLQVTVQVELVSALLEQYETSAEQQALLEQALAELRDTLEPVLPELAAAEQAELEAGEALTLAVNNKEDTAAELRRAHWRAIKERDRWQHRLDKARDRFISQVGELDDDQRLYSYMAATMAEMQWANTNVASLAASEIETKDDRPDKFGHHPEDPEKNYLEIHLVQAVNPEVLDGTFEPGRNAYGVENPKVQQIPLRFNQEYNLRMVVSEVEGEEVVDQQEIMLGSAIPLRNSFDASKWNNLV
ncbi:MAG TPA: hypothetical protein ENO21_03085, partial [Firmicutes bacterium]|nr:hypothetical protein [Bacillota bacterium]